MALLTTVVALLGTTLGAVTRHMTDAAAGVTGLTPAAATTTATTVATAAAIAALTALRWTTGGAITCYVTLTTTTVALTTAAAATSTAVGIPARTAPARATIATSTVARTTTANGAGLSAVTSKVRLASTFVAGLWLRSCSAFATNVSFGSAVVASWSSLLRTVASLVRRITAVVAAAIHDCELKLSSQ